MNLSPDAFMIRLQIGRYYHRGKHPQISSLTPMVTEVPNPGSPFCLHPLPAFAWTNSLTFVNRSGSRQKIETILSVSHRGNLVQGAGDMDVFLLY